MATPLTWWNCHDGEFVATADIRFTIGKRQRVLHPGDPVPKEHFPKAALKGLFRLRKIDPVPPPTTEESDQTPGAGETAA